MKLVSLVLALGLCLPTLATERPSLPGPAIDTELLGGKTPREFFTQRMQGCRDLETTENTYREERAKLQTLKDSNAAANDLKFQQERAETALKAWIGRVKDCGPCHIRPIKRVVVTSAGKTENWFVSDGSCFLPSLTRDEAARAFEVRAKSLEQLSQYKYSSGGFRQVVEFFAVDPVSGRPETQATIPSPYEAFIAVRGPTLFGVRTAAGYYFGGGYRKWSDSDGAHYHSFFTAKRPPRGFRQPRIRETDITGNPHRVRLIQLSDAQGQWYLTEDGYLRYYTAADFGLSLKFLSDMAEATLFETLLDLTQRGLPE